MQAGTGRGGRACSGAGGGGAGRAGHGTSSVYQFLHATVRAPVVLAFDRSRQERLRLRAPVTVGRCGSTVARKGTHDIRFNLILGDISNHSSTERDLSYLKDSWLFAFKIRH